MQYTGIIIGMIVAYMSYYPLPIDLTVLSTGDNYYAFVYFYPMVVSFFRGKRRKGEERWKLRYRNYFLQNWNTTTR